MRREVQKKIVVNGGRVPYWINPAVIFPLVTVPTTVLFVAISPDAFISEMRVPKYDAFTAAYTYSYVLLMVLLGMSLSLSLGHQGFSKGKGSQAEGPQLLPSLTLVGAVSATLAILAHLYLFTTSGIDINLISATLRGEQGAIYQLKDSLEKTSGITSFVNLAPFWYVFVAYKKLVLRQRLTPLESGVSIALFAMTALRGLSTNERRAIIEVFIPAVVVVLLLRRSWPKWVRLLIKFAPVVGPVLLFSLFFVTEYWRTWLPAYSKTSYLSYPDWVLIRFSGYYVTSINNGVAALYMEIPTYGYYMFNGLYRFPFLSSLFSLDELRTIAVYNFTMMLSQHLNPEFNNQGGLIVPLIEFGYLAGGFILLLFGVLCGLAYQSARRKELIGLLTYPMFFFAALESTRVWSILSSQAVLQFLFVGIMVFWLSQRRQSVRSGRHSKRVTTRRF